jgi:HB1, ASXL, restriction endonuclease HTH domain/Protein of unknown function (DUF2786)
MVDASKIAKLRAKAMSTAYPEEAAAFERKAIDLMERNGISEEAVQRALDAIFGGRAGWRSRSAQRPTTDRSPHSRSAHGPTNSTPPRSRSTHGPRTARPAEARSMTEAAIWVLEDQARAMRPAEVWALVEHRGLYTRSRGKTPWATIGAKFATRTDLFERVAPGIYQLRE